MQERVERLIERLRVVEEELGNPDAPSDQKKYRELTQEHAYLSEVKETWSLLQKATVELGESREMVAQESDPEFLDVLQEEIKTLEADVERLSDVLSNLLVPPDPLDHRNTLLELRAGTGGEEAALFVADCVRMYTMYAANHGWTREVLSCTESERGGYKEFIMALSGRNVHRFLQYEAGTHRVQRVPETETQGRVHTSAITVAVLVEPDEEEAIHLDDKDLKIETCRASGAGGQHVNVTDSAVRIVHIPSGIVVTCQDERSQLKNKEKALRVLKGRLADQQRREREESMASKRAEQVGTGDRSGRIRTYNFSQNRVTDHRINLTKYNLSEVMDGRLDEIIGPVVVYFYQRKLKGDDEER